LKTVSDVRDAAFRLRRRGAGTPFCRTALLFGLSLFGLSLFGLGGCRDDAGESPDAQADTTPEGSRAPVRQHTPVDQDVPVPVVHSTTDLLARVASDTGLEFSGGGDDLPFPPGDVQAMPPIKLVRVIAESAGLVPAVDPVGFEDGTGGLYVTDRFLLAGTTPEVADLVRRLDNSDARIREETLEDVAELTGILRALVLGGMLATDSDADVRAAAAGLLGEERDDRGVEALIRALGDKDPFVVECARASLVLMGDSYVRPALQRAARYAPSRVREAAQIILDENFGVELDPDVDTAVPTSAVMNAIVVHDLEGRTTCVKLDAEGTCEMLIHARGRISGRRSGTVDGAPVLLEALALCGATEPPPEPSNSASDLVFEADAFVLHLVERSGDRHAAEGDLREHPPAVRAAIAAVVTAAGALPEAPRAAVYVTARIASDAEAEGARIVEIPTDEKDVQQALHFPGWPAACDAARLEQIFGDTNGPWLVRWRDNYVELSVLRGAAGEGD